MLMSDENDLDAIRTAGLTINDDELALVSDEPCALSRFTLRRIQETGAKGSLSTTFAFMGADKGMTHEVSLSIVTPRHHLYGVTR